MESPREREGRNVPGHTVAETAIVLVEHPGESAILSFVGVVIPGQFAVLSYPLFLHSTYSLFKVPQSVLVMPILSPSDGGTVNYAAM